MRKITIVKVLAIEIIEDERIVTLKVTVRYMFRFFTLSAMTTKNGCIVEVKIDIPNSVIANIFGSI